MLVAAARLSLAADGLGCYISYGLPAVLAGTRG